MLTGATGTEAQPNPPLHQGSRQPPHKIASNTILQTYASRSTQTVTAEFVK